MDPLSESPSIQRKLQSAMRLSLLIGAFAVTGKLAAYFYTGSAAILSDAAESVIHEFAVLFAAFSLWLSVRPADLSYRYGYQRIAFFSAAFEGALIVLAAAYVLVAVVQKWLAGLPLENLGVGTLAVAAAGVVNGALGLYLVRLGKKHGSIIIEANGKHVLTDCWTSVGVVVGLVLVQLTGVKEFDPICAIVVALNIVWSGGGLVWCSVRGLMDYADPEISSRLTGVLDELTRERRVEYHGLKFRNLGHRTRVELHLLFPYDLAVGEAHRIATEIEDELARRIEVPLEVSTHLEAAEDHDEVHHDDHPRGR